MVGEISSFCIGLITDNTCLLIEVYLLWMTVSSAYANILTVNIVKREEWGAAPTKPWPKLELLETPVPYVVMSYFEPNIKDDKMALQVVQHQHMEAGQPDIESNFLIGRDGTIYEGRGWKFQSCKSYAFPNHDGEFLEISYIGNVDDESVSHPVYKSTLALLDYGRQNNYLTQDYEILSQKNATRSLPS